MLGLFGVRLAAMPIVILVFGGVILVLFWDCVACNAMPIVCRLFGMVLFWRRVSAGGRLSPVLLQHNLLTALWGGLV